MAPAQGLHIRCHFFSRGLGCEGPHTSAVLLVAGMGPKRASSAGASSSTNPKRRLRRVTTEAVAEKALRDNCKHLTPEECHILRNSDGESIFEVVMKHLRMKRDDDNYVFGAKLWRDIKSQFRRAMDPHEVLVVPQPPEAVPPALLKAVISAKRNHADRAPLSAYLAAAPNLNRTSQIGVLRLALSMNPRCKTHLPCCLDIVRWLMRAKISDAFPKGFELMNAFCDATLSQVFVSSGMTAQEFVKVYSDIVASVLPMDALKVVLLVKDDDYSGVQSELGLLVASSELGTQLWSFAMMKHLQSIVEEVVQAELDNLDGKSLTREVLDAVRRAITTKVEKVSGVSLLPPRREVTIRYRGQSFAGRVNSTAQHAALATAAYWKSRAVEEGMLAQFWAEKLVFTQTIHKAATPTVTETLSAAAEHARAEFDKHFALDEGLEGKAIYNTLKPRFAKYLAVDGEFACELMLTEAVCGDQSGARLLSACMQALPTDEDCDTTAEEALQRLSALSQGPLYRLAPKSSQAQVKLATQFLTRILDQRALDLGESARDPSMKSIVDSLQYFVTAKIPAADEGTPGTVVYGAEALKVIHSTAMVKVAAGSVDFSIVAPLRTFEHLLPPDLVPSAKELIKKAESKTIHTKAARTKGLKKPSEAESSCGASASGAVYAEAFSLFT